MFVPIDRISKSINDEIIAYIHTKGLSEIFGLMDANLYMLKSDNKISPCQPICLNSYRFHFFGTSECLIGPIIIVRWTHILKLDEKKQSIETTSVWFSPLCGSKTVWLFIIVHTEEVSFSCFASFVALACTDSSTNLKWNVAFIRNAHDNPQVSEVRVHGKSLIDT